MATGNTGYLINPTLKKIVVGGPHDGEPLDVNNNLCSDSGLPQSTMANSELAENYRVLNEEACPIPSTALIWGFTTESAGASCTIELDISVYWSGLPGDPGIGDRIYSDPELTALHATGFWSDGINWWQVELDGEGLEIITAMGTCGEIGGGSTMLSLRFSVALESACSTGLETVYIDSAYSDIEPGIVVFTNNTLVTELSEYNYIVSSGGIIYNLDSTTGLVGSATELSC